MLHHITRSMLLLCLPLMAAACGGAEKCVVPGVAEECYCAASMPGARVCSEDKMWGTCDCSGNVSLPNAVSPSQSGTTAGNGSAGNGGAGIGGAGIVGGRKDSGVALLDDGGVEPDAGMMSGDDASVHPPMGAAYRACMSPTDCDPGAKCITTAGVPANSTVCAPACVNTVDCPVPEGSYESKIACVTGYCQLDCTPVLFAPLLTCPTGMTCIAAALGNAFCHDDGK